MQRFTGTVKTWVDQKGFGFITPDAGDDDVFVHRTGIRGARGKSTKLLEGARVSYDTEPGEKGPRAIDVVEVV